MKIKKVTANNHKKCFEILTKQGSYSLPYSKAYLVPTTKNPVVIVYVDSELAYQGITYKLKAGQQNSIPYDAFLDYNKDPEYIAKILLHKLTIDSLEFVKKSGLSRRELARKLKTSPSQLYRLLNPANNKKTIDQMIKLLSALGFEFDYQIKKINKIAA